MAQLRLLALIACFGVLAGCDQDVLPGVFERRSSDHDRRATEEQRERDEESSRLAGERQLFRVGLAADAAFVSNELARIEKDLETVSADRSALSERIRELSRPKSGTGMKPRAEVVLGLLDDDAVNALAVRYLGHDFRLTRLELAEDIDEVVESRRQKEAALAESKSAYEARLKEVQQENEKARSSAQAALGKLKSEIAALENRREQLKRKLNIVAVTERNRLSRELDDIDSQLRTLRISYDSMRSARNVTESRMRAGREADQSVDAAARRRREEEERTQRRFRDRKDLQSIFADAEQSTVHALEKAMCARAAKMESSLLEVRKAQTEISAAVANIDGLGLEALKRVRREIEGTMTRVSSPK